MKRTGRTAILSLTLCLALAASAESAAPAGTRTSWQCDLLAGSTDYIPIRDWAGCTP